MGPKKFLLLLLSFPILFAQQEIPLNLNLPTTSYLREGWGVIFTHRFTESVRGNSQNLFGLDGYAYSGIGFWGSVTGIPELNYGIYRTSDQKTIVVSVQGVLYSEKALRSSLRVEHFNEKVKENTSTINVYEGISGVTYQLPTEYFSGPWTIGITPTFITQTSTGRSVFNVPLAMKYQISNKQSLIVEFYPVPSSLRNYQVPVSILARRSLRVGFSLGYQFQTFGHRFTLIGTNTQGTTAHQVIPGDYQGIGARASGDWGLAFNIVRLF